MYSSYLNRSMIFYMGKLEMPFTDFVKNGFGESWDSSCEKSRVPSLFITNESQLKKQGVLNWKYLGPYVAR